MRLEPGFALLACAVLPGAAAAQSTVRASVATSGSEADFPSGAPSLSADGRYAAFESLATNLVPGDTNGVSDIFVRDLVLGTTTRVSVDPAGGEADGPSLRPALSADGSCVAFHSRATNLVAGDTNNEWDVFVRELASGLTTRVSLDSAGLEAYAASQNAALSADGRFVAFESLARLVPNDLDTGSDVYLFDRASGTLLLVSAGTGSPLQSGPASAPAISADGTRVAFESDADDLVPGDTNDRRDVFVFETPGGTTQRASVDSAGVQSDGYSRVASLSADGLHVAFQSSATNLVAGDGNSAYDVFVHDLATGLTTRVSVDSAGLEASGYVERGALSADGRLVVFQSSFPYLVANDTNGASDVFVHDLATGVTARVSVSSPGSEGDYLSVAGTLTPDGRRVAFVSLASTLVAGDFNDTYDVFVRDRALLGSEFCFGDGTQGACPCGNSGAAGRGCENSAATGGALLFATGTIVPDTLQFCAQGELAGALSILLQGNTAVAPALSFGDGLRCAGGLLKRLYVANAVLGALSVPGAGDLSVSAQSGALGDPLGPGAQRFYQVYYRDPDPGYCAAPAGNTWNVSNAVQILW
jgi:Tol biopolymer transport system component